MLSFKQFIIENTIFAIGPHGIGSWSYHDSEHGSTISHHPVDKTVGNEPFKDNSYFRRPKIKTYVGGIRRAVSKNEKMPPVQGTPHPENPNVMSIVDGNHRLRGIRNARASTVAVENIPHDNIRLLHPDHQEKHDLQSTVNQGTPLSSFKEKDGSYHMDKPREELGGLTLRHYFVNPDGSHKFKAPR